MLGSPCRCLRFDVFELRVDSRELRRCGRGVALQRLPFELLELLIERAGEIVSREEAQRRLWSDGTHVDFERGLNTALKKLRRALDDRARSPRFIETLPRRGYRFIAPLSIGTPSERRAWRGDEALGSALAALERLPGLNVVARGLALRASSRRPITRVELALLREAVDAFSAQGLQRCDDLGIDPPRAA